jgi:hypothetical protein
MNAVKQSKTDRSIVVNRILYGGLVLVAAWNLLFSKDYGSAAANMGIALIFDPFNPSVSWDQRPFYQRAWLIVHLCIGLGFFLMAIIIK